jgi:hypothetical protein
VLLEGESLSEYVFWHQSLTPELADGWEEFLDDLSPEDDLAGRLQRFRESLAEGEADRTGCDLLEAALKEE